MEETTKSSEFVAGEVVASRGIDFGPAFLWLPLRREHLLFPPLIEDWSNPKRRINFDNFFQLSTNTGATLFFTLSRYFPNDIQLFNYTLAERLHLDVFWTIFCTLIASILFYIANN